MAEYVGTAVQNVAVNQNVLFTETPVPSCNCSIVHREGSGIVTLRGNTNQCRALYKVSFGGNIAAVESTAAISVAIALEGEALASATAIETPGATGAYYNVFVAAFVSVPKGCCATVSVENISTQAITVQNSNLIVERVA